jgi:hypothetical protein
MAAERTQTIAALAAGAVAAGALAAILLRGSDTGAPAAPPADASSRAEAAAAHAAPDDHAQPPPAPARSAAPAAGDGVGLLEVQVVAADSLQPLPDAEVFVLTDSRWDSLPVAQRMPWEGPKIDWEARVRALGAAARPDRDGIVRVPRPLAWATFVGRRERHCGRYDFQARDPGERRLALRPDHALRVRVTQSGAPRAGVPIALFALEQGNQDAQECGATAADGTFVLPHSQDVLREQRARAQLEAFGIGPCIAARTVVPARLDLGEPPPEELHFDLPPTGRLTIRLVDEHGRPKRTEGFVLIEVLSERARRDALAPPRHVRAAVPWGTSEVTLEHVEPGLSLDLRGVLDGAPTERLRGEGPQRAGETAVLRLPVPDDHPILTGTLVDPNGQPLPLLGFVASAELDAGEHRKLLGTDTDGSFRLHLAPSASGRELRRLTLVHSQERIATGRQARFEGPRPLTAGENLLGTLLLDTAPLLAAGRIRASDGDALRGVTIEVLALDEESDGTRWRGLPGLGVTHDPASGAFTVRGAPAAGALRLRAAHGACIAHPGVPLALGARDLDIVLERGSRLVARLLVDEGLDPALLHCRLSSSNGDWGERPQRRDAGVGECAFGALPPGAYRLEVRGSGAAPPAAILDGLRVAAGTCDDERLAAIDLRGRLQRITVRATGPGGEAAPWPAAVHVLGSHPEMLPLAAHGATLLASGPLDLHLSAAGLRDAVLRGVAADTETRLAPALAVRLVPQGLAADGGRLEFVLRPAVDAPWSRPIPCWRDANGAHAAALPAPGVHVIDCAVVHGNRRVPLRAAPDRIVVRDTAGVQEFAIELRE